MVWEEKDEYWDTTNIIVKHVIKQTGVTLEDWDIERAHRVGGEDIQGL